jgi:hypothetical protein
MLEAYVAQTFTGGTKAKEGAAVKTKNSAASKNATVAFSVLCKVISSSSFSI